MTHGITFLPQVDQIIVLKDGDVSEVGSYKELLAQKGAFAEFLLQHLEDEDGDDDIPEGVLFIHRSHDPSLHHYFSFFYLF